MLTGQNSYAYRSILNPGPGLTYTYYVSQQELNHWVKSLNGNNTLGGAIVGIITGPIILGLQHNGVATNHRGDIFILEKDPAPSIAGSQKGPTAAEIAQKKQTESATEAQRIADFKKAANEKIANKKAEEDKAYDQLKAPLIDAALTEVRKEKAEEFASTGVAQVKEVEASQKSKLEKLKAEIKSQSSSLKALTEALCFSGETPVAVKDENNSLGYRSQTIDSLRRGDSVVSCQLNKSGNTCEFRPIQAVMKREVDHLYRLNVGGKVIRATGNHPFYSPNKKDWIEAQNLRKGDSLLSITGELLPLEDTQVERGHFTVYNLDIQDNHNYFASDVLVHNCNLPNSLPAAGTVTAVISDTAPLLAEGAATAALGAAAIPAAFVGSAAALGYTLHKATKPAEHEDSPMRPSVKGEPSKELSEVIENFLGENPVVKTNKKGDKIFISADGQRKVRADIEHSHGDKPHIHIETKNPKGEWVDATDQHRFYPGQ